VIRRVSIANRFGVGQGCRPLLIAGPCVLESEELALSVAAFLADLAGRLPLNVVFKGSFDKANRSSRASYRGPGEAEGLRILAKVRERYGLPVTTDVHDPRQARAVAPGSTCSRSRRFCAARPTCWSRRARPAWR